MASGDWVLVRSPGAPGGSLTRREDPSGREYFWIGGGVSSWTGREDSDFRAVRAGYASLTPLHLDLTNYSLINEVRTWPLSV